MRLMWNRKDGGPKSHVWATGIEIKSWFSVLFLRFTPGTRNAYHSHAFNSCSWLLGGELMESFINLHGWRRYWPSFKPIITRRDDYHQVASLGVSYVLSFRGPWVDVWNETDMETRRARTLTHGRMEV